MAKSSAKRLHFQNQKRLKELKTGFLIVNAIHIAVRIWQGTAITDMSGFAGINIIFALLYFYMSSLATPIMNVSGNVDSVSVELNGSNLTSYLFDVIYIGWFVSLGVLYSSKFWLVYLVIPMYAFYRAMKAVLYFFK